jgi:hypothetical protein
LMTLVQHVDVVDVVDVVACCWVLSWGRRLSSGARPLRWLNLERPSAQGEKGEKGEKWQDRDFGRKWSCQCKYITYLSPMSEFLYFSKKNPYDKLHRHHILNTYFVYKWQIFSVDICGNTVHIWKWHIYENICRYFLLRPCRWPRIWSPISRRCRGKPKTTRAVPWSKNDAAPPGTGTHRTHRRTLILVSWSWWNMMKHDVLQFYMMFYM